MTSEFIVPASQPLVPLQLNAFWVKHLSIFSGLALRLAAIKGYANSDASAYKPQTQSLTVTPDTDARLAELDAKYQYGLLQLPQSLTVEHDLEIERGKYQTANSDLEACRQSVSKLESDLASARAQYDDLTVKNQTLQQQIAQHDIDSAERSRLLQVVSTNNDAISAHATRTKDLESQIATQNARIQELEAAEVAMKRNYDDSIKLSNGQADLIENLTAKVINGKKALDSAQAEIERLRSTHDSLSEQLKTNIENGKNTADVAAQLDDTRTRLTEAQQSRDTAQQSLAQLQIDLDNCKTRAAAAETKTAELETGNRSLNEKIAELEKQLSELREHHSTATKRVGDHESTIQKLEKEVADLQTELKNSYVVHEGAETSKAELESELAGYKTARDLLQTQVDDLRATILSQESQIDELKQQAGSRTADLDTCTQKIADITTQHQAALEQLRAQCDTEKSALAQSSGSNADMLQTLQASKTAVDTQLSSVQQQLDDCRTKSEQCETDYTAVSTALVELTTGDSGLSPFIDNGSRPDDLLTLIKSIKDRIVALNTEISTHKSRIVVLEQQISDTVATTTASNATTEAAVAATISEKDTKISALQLEIDRLKALNAQLAELRAQVKDLNDKNSVIVQSSAATDDELNRTKADLQRVTADNQTLTAQRQALQNTNDTLSVRLTNVEHTHREKLKELGDEHSNHKTQIADLQNQLDAARAQLGTLQTRYDDIETKFRDLKDTSADVQQHIKKLETENQNLTAQLTTANTMYVAPATITYVNSTSGVTDDSSRRIAELENEVRELRNRDTDSVEYVMVDNKIDSDLDDQRKVLSELLQKIPRLQSEAPKVYKYTSELAVDRIARLRKAHPDLKSIHNWYNIKPWYKKLVLKELDMPQYVYGILDRGDANIEEMNNWYRLYG